MVDLGVFGTQFEELEDEEKGSVSKKPLSVENQIVTDEKGRRRFHGAFTGGFSAGYFNTVGTREGWIPATFKSSRSQRAAEQSARPEAFMDDEDLGAYGIAPRQVRTTSNFEEALTSGKRAAEPFAWERSAMSTAETSRLVDLVKPVGESVGAKLLKKMGWRPGQGVGPKLSKRSLNRQQRVEGKVVAAEREEAINEIDEMAPGFLFAPDDVDVCNFESKADLHGLGYSGLDSRSLADQSKSRASTAYKQSKRAGIRGQAFGVGAFEEDDEDIYTVDDLTRYDYTLGPVSRFDDKAATVLEGFTRAGKAQAPKKFYAPPALPRDFKPVHASAQLEAPSRDSKTGPLTTAERAHMLGEGTSVMSLLRDEDRARLEAARQGRLAPAAARPATGSGGERRGSRFDREPAADAPPAEPFAGDAAKQRRFADYRHYVQRGMIMAAPADTTEWEWELQAKEFQTHLTPELLARLPEAHARQRPLVDPATVRPFAHLLKSKFTSAQRPDDDDSPAGGGVEDDKLQAVRMNMFGPLTREVAEWHPYWQLCKRFNIPDPYPDAPSGGADDSKQKERAAGAFGVGDGALPSTAQEVANRRSAPTDVQPRPPTPPQPPSSAAVDADEPERPSMDLFRAIFTTSDVESSDAPPTDDDDDAANVAESLPTDAGMQRGLVVAVENLSTEQLTPSTSALPWTIEAAAPTMEYGPVLPPIAEGPTLPPNSVVAEHRRNKHKKKRSGHKGHKKKKEKKSSKKKSRKRSVSGSSVEILSSETN